MLVFVVYRVGSCACDKLHSFRGILMGACVCVCLIVCDLETSKARRIRLESDCCATEKRLMYIGMHALMYVHMYICMYVCMSVCTMYCYSFLVI